MNTLTELKKMIRQSIAAKIAEAKQARVSPPKSFPEFRRQFSTALRAAGAPEDLVAEAEDDSYEGGPVFGAMWDAWTNLELEIRDLKGLPPQEASDEWASMCAAYVHDAVIDMTSGYQDPMNYEPGRRPAKINASKLAQDTVDAMASGKSALGTAKKSAAKKKVKSITVEQVAAAIAKALENEGSTTKTVKTYEDEPEVDVIVSNPDSTEDEIVFRLGMTLESNGVDGCYFKTLGDGTIFVYEDADTKTEVSAPASLSGKLGVKNMRITVAQYVNTK